uniref:Uncharacterized protein n=1 Tax=Sphaerodactylus townsendi TaxID=933632 RepID=A0ACB8GDT5_9SAUR
MNPTSRANGDLLYERKRCFIISSKEAILLASSQIAGRKAENWPLFTELPETKSSATQKKSFFDGDTLYVAMYSCCTILILGLVLLALLKTRDFAKQAKNPSPAHLSEKRLYDLSKPWVRQLCG